MARHPALSIEHLDPDLVLACVDDFAPSAAEHRDQRFRVFFLADEQRERAAAALRSAYPSALVEPLDVDDEDWARRSQANLKPVTVGRVTVYPELEAREEWLKAGSSGFVSVFIQPSTGFGTGHHATTRLCLEALQSVDVRGRTMLDIGTGSGILAITAALLGASEALGIDIDADAVQSARENLALNPAARGVRFDIADLMDATLPIADVVAANLTGATLVAALNPLCRAVAVGGTLIASGFLVDEEAAVRRALSPATVVWSRREDEWIALAVNNLRAPGV